MPEPSGETPPPILRKANPFGDPYVRSGVGAAAALASLGVLYLLGVLGLYDVKYATSILPQLGTGLGTTAELVGVVIPTGFALGFFMGWARTTHSTFLRGLGAVYVEYFRGMPPLVLIFFSFLISTIYVRQLTGNPFLARSAALWFGAFALAFHSGAYQTEIIRAGLLSVPTGQTEAADAIGLSRFQSIFTITLPQAFRVALPALGNEFASVIKDTSLLSAIGWFDLMNVGFLLDATAIRTNFDQVFIIWPTIALLYFGLTFLVTFVVRQIENWSKVPGLEAPEA